MKTFKLLVILSVACASLVYAMNIETGKEFPATTGSAELVKEAENKLQTLYQFIMRQKNIANTAKFATNKAADDFRKNTESRIKNTLKEVKELLNKAESAPIGF